MMLGYFGSGGSSSSSSSSNLSPLAPPFTVDRSNPKPNSTPLGHFTEPPYAVPFGSSLQNWQYSHSSSSGPDFLVDSIRTASMPSTIDYGYMGSEPINPPSTHWSALNSSVKSGSESISINPPGAHWSALNPSPKSMTDSFSCYPPYVSPAINDDIPLVALNEPSYDFLSTSGLVPNDGSSQVDYTQSLSGLEYTPQWEGIWNGLGEGKRDKRMETDASFFSEEANIARSMAYKNYMKQGACGSETTSKGKEDSAGSQGNYADVIGRENHIGPLITGKLDGKLLTSKNRGLNPIELSKGPSFRAFPIFPESRPQAPSPERPKESSTNQNPDTLYVKRLQMFDTLNDCISVNKFSPALVIKPPAVVTTFPAPGTVSSKNLEIGDIATFNSNDVVDSRISLKEKEPHLPLRSEAKEGFLGTNQLSFQIGRNGHQTIVLPYSTKEETSNKLPTNNHLDHAFKATSGFQVLDINVPDVDSSETVKSAEDSPCWKGAPTSHFSSFEAFEDETQHLMKKPQTSDGVNLQGAQINRPYNVSPKVSSQGLCEKTPVDNVFSLSPKRTPFADDRFDSAKPSHSKGVQSSHAIVKPRNGYDLSYESNDDSDFKTSQTRLPNLEEDILISKRKLQLQAGVVDHAIYAVENVLLSSVEDTAKPTTAEKMNVQMLVKAMHNLSELLIFHCSNDVCALKEQDHKALGHVIGNLDVCMSRKIVQVTPTQESMLCEKGPSNMLGMGAYAGKSQVTNAAAVSSPGQANFQFARLEKRNYDLTGKKVEKPPGFVSLRDDNADLSKGHNMVQAIKKVLDENLESKEELESPTLLYKNLWLEAEAELCSISYRARFDRMKREMEKCTSDKAKGVCESNVYTHKLSNSKVSSDPNTTHKLTPEANNTPLPNTSIQDSPFSHPDIRDDDVEASVMARFNILKCRTESNPFNVEERELGEVDDAGVSGKGSQSSDVTVGSHLDHLAGKDDAMVMQPRANNMLLNQFTAGWYNSSHSSSDWEHVLKDEFACQN